MLKRWRAVGNFVSDLTGPRFESQTSRVERNALNQLANSNFLSSRKQNLKIGVRKLFENAHCSGPGLIGHKADTIFGIQNDIESRSF